MKRVVFRADAGTAIGSGHAMRCLALSQAFLTGGWSVGFAGSRETFESVKAFEKANVERLVLNGLIEEEPRKIAARWPNIDILVFDHYGRDANLEGVCRPFVDRIVVIDDLADRQHDCDVLVDSNAISRMAYRTLLPANCLVLIGPAFAPLAPEFRRVRPKAMARRDGRPVERVLVSFGQIDAGNASELALDALEAAGFAGKIDVALGSAAPHFATIKKRTNSRIQLHIDVSNMAELMANVDLALGAGGTTSWERCCLGLPSLLVELANNQRGVIQLIEKKGAGISLGSIEKLSVERIGVALSEAANKTTLLRMAKAGTALVDGRGSDRTLLAAIGPVMTKTGEEVSLRIAEATDESWLFELQQRPETRKFANIPQAPSRNEHADWFRRTLNDPQNLLMIIEFDGAPAGVLRLDYGKASHRVSIAVDPTHHRHGIAAAALALASRISPGYSLDAQVKPENKASLALFAAASYRHMTNDLYRREPS